MGVVVYRVRAVDKDVAHHRRRPDRVVGDRRADGGGSGVAARRIAEDERAVAREVGSRLRRPLDRISHLDVVAGRDRRLGLSAGCPAGYTGAQDEHVIWARRGAGLEGRSNPKGIGTLAGGQPSTGESKERDAFHGLVSHIVGRLPQLSRETVTATTSGMPMSCWHTVPSRFAGRRITSQDPCPRRCLSNRRRTGPPKSVRADEQRNPAPRVWCGDKNSGANTMARRPWRGRQ